MKVALKRRHQAVAAAVAVGGGVTATDGGGEVVPPAVTTEPAVRPTEYEGDTTEVDTTSAPGTEDEAGRTGVSDVDRGDLVPPMQEDEFKKYFDDAALGVFSSDGELTDIAARQVQLAKPEVPGSPPEPVIVKSEDEACGPRVPAGLLADWPGDYGFKLRLPHSGRAREPQYSSLLNKLYIAQNRYVTLQLSTSVAGPAGLALRAQLVFTSPDHAQDAVKVCYQHSRPAAGLLRDALAPHMLRLTAGEPPVDVKYLHYTDTGRHAVLVQPLPAPGPGASHVPVTVRFTDLSSCPGGINRRETAVVFTLEQDGRAVGRRLLPVRVCTCPKRDREHEERERSGGAGPVGGKRPPPDTGESSGAVGGGGLDSAEYWVLARGDKNYRALKQVGVVLEEARGGGVMEYEAANVTMNKRRR